MVWLVHGRDQCKDLIPNYDHTESQLITLYDRLVIVQKHFSSSKLWKQSVIEVPQVIENLPMDQQIKELPQNLKQIVKPQAPQGEPTLRWSNHEKKKTIHSDYKVYLQEADVGAINDLETFS